MREEGETGGVNDINEGRRRDRRRERHK